MLTNIINIFFLFSLTLSNDPQMRSLKNITVTQGLYSDRITVEWEKTESKTYTVMRSQFKDREFTVINQTENLKYEDTSIEKGIKYWYKVKPDQEISTDEDDEDIYISDEEYNSFPENELKKSDIKKDDELENETEIKKPACYSGYTSIDTPPGIKLSELLKLKKAKLKASADAKERERQKQYMEFLKPLYMNPVKLTLFMTIAKPYLEKGDLKILNDCSEFEIKKETNQIIFYGSNYQFKIVFESNKFTFMISETEKKDLAEVLLKNADLYCIPTGKEFIVDKNGITRLVNTFDAVGLSTGYLKNDKEWRTRTIMLATSRSDLKEKMKNITKKEEE